MEAGGIAGDEAKLSGARPAGITVAGAADSVPGMASVRVDGEAGAAVVAVEQGCGSWGRRRSAPAVSGSVAASAVGSSLAISSPTWYSPSAPSRGARLPADDAARRGRSRWPRSRSGGGDMEVGQGCWVSHRWEHVPGGTSGGILSESICDTQSVRHIARPGIECRE
jgi:hypothetical protein